MSALFSRLARLFRLECQKRQALLAELSAIRTDGFSFALPPSIFNDGIPNLHHFQTIREYSPYPVQNCLGMAVFTPEQRQLGRELLQQLQGLVSTERIKGVQIDLRAIDGLFNSRDAGKAPWATLADFASARECSYIKCNTDADFEKCVDHAFSKHAGQHSFHTYSWDGRVFWANNDGSHHGAVAHYQAVRQNREFVLEGNLTKHTLNQTAVEWITGHFHVVAATEKAATKLVAIIGDNGMPYFITRNVTPYYGSELIFLAKSHTSCTGSDDVGQLLTSLGWADAGAWLKHLSSQTD